MESTKRKIFLALSLFLLLQSAAMTQSLRLFHIERNKNNSIVCYDLEVDNKTIAKNNPIDVYWEMPDQNNARNSLSVIQNKLVYGLTIEQVKGNSILFKLKAYPDRIVEVVYDSKKQQANAFTLINGSYVILKKLYIYATPPLYSSVEYIILVGLDPNTGETKKEKITNK